MTTNPLPVLDMADLADDAASFRASLREATHMMGFF